MADPDFRLLGDLAEASFQRKLAAFVDLEIADAALRREIADRVERFHREARDVGDDLSAARALEAFRLAAERKVAELERARDALHPELASARAAAMRGQGKIEAVRFLSRRAEKAAYLARLKSEEDDRAGLVALKRAALVRAAREEKQAKSRLSE